MHLSVRRLDLPEEFDLLVLGTSSAAGLLIHNLCKNLEGHQLMPRKLRYELHIGAVAALYEC